MVAPVVGVETRSLFAFRGVLICLVRNVTEPDTFSTETCRWTHICGAKSVVGHSRLYLLTLMLLRSP